MITDAQYAIIFTTTLVYLNHPGTLIILYGTAAHTNSNMLIAHTEAVRLFREMSGVKQALVQKNIFTVEEAYLVDIHQQNRGGCTYAHTRQLRPVDAAQAPGTGGHCQEDDL